MNFYVDSGGAILGVEPKLLPLYISIIQNKCYIFRIFIE